MVHSTIFDTQMSVLYRGVAPAESFPKKLKIFLFHRFSHSRQKYPTYNNYEAEIYSCDQSSTQS